ncbi:DUF6543 domain-containing protein [Pseudomonas sp. MWU16-30323]|uniref:dermonecrotic toxin domain-containing protein n=1 Tax=Pseudomonas sp. MWU16-30323 TaxID=2878094 RepID=UPI001CFA46B1|nr:DUF6543 domain-containing protein [Pseudomonas sp. MWU16-30323]
MTAPIVLPHMPIQTTMPPTPQAPGASSPDDEQVHGSQFSNSAAQTPRLAPHPELDSYVLNNAQAPKSAAQFTAEMVKKQFKEKFGQDVDPDNTYVVTFAYNKQGNAPPYPAQIISKTSLTEAAQRNQQYTEKTDALTVERSDTGYDAHISLKAQKSIPIYKASPHPSQFAGTNEHTTRFHQGIYTASDSSTPDQYDAANRIPVPVADFQQQVWDTAYASPYRTYLSSFLDAKSELTYRNLSKIAFINAAESQHLERSLDDDDLDLARRVADVGSTPRQELSLGHDIYDHLPDQQVDIKFLSINGRASTDIFYAIDKKTSRTLLYIPGNSSPIHPFDTPTDMHNWLSKQFSLPTSNAAFTQHFKMEDHSEIQRVMRNVGDGYRRFGANNWSEARHDESIVRGEKIYTGDPFHESSLRMRAHALADVDQLFVSNKQVTEGLLLEAAKNLGNGLLILGGIAASFIPGPVGAFVATMFATHGAIEVGEGIKDAIDGKPGAAKRIAFGALNAVPLVGRGIFKAVKAAKGPGKLPVPKAPPTILTPARANPFSSRQLQRIDGHVAPIESKMFAIEKTLKDSPKEFFITHDANRALTALRHERTAWQSGELLASRRALSNSPLATGVNAQRATLEKTSQKAIDDLFKKLEINHANAHYDFASGVAGAQRGLKNAPTPDELLRLKAVRDATEQSVSDIKPHTSSLSRPEPAAPSRTPAPANQPPGFEEQTWVKIHRHVTQLDEARYVLDSAGKNNPAITPFTQELVDVRTALLAERNAWQTDKILSGAEKLPDVPSTHPTLSALRARTEAAAKKLVSKIESAYDDAGDAFNRTFSDIVNKYKAQQTAKDLLMNKSSTASAAEIENLKNNLSNATRALEEPPTQVGFEQLADTRTHLKNLLDDLKPLTPFQPTA